MITALLELGAIVITGAIAFTTVLLFRLGDKNNYDKD